jgi:hypothetical protein
MLGSMWNPDQLAEIAAGALRDEAVRLALEQTVRGVDGLAELEVHPILWDAFAVAGFGVHPEQPYPGDVPRRSIRAERERCDIALTPSAEARLLDPVAELKRRDAAAGTLFAAPEAPEPGCVGPADAYWLELKVVGQFTFSAGLSGPNRAYASEVLRAADDLKKLAAEPSVECAGLMLVLFTADAETADHDLAVFIHRCIDGDLPVASPSVSRIEIPDLIGNRVCTVMLMPVRSGRDAAAPRVRRPRKKAAVKRVAEFPDPADIIDPGPEPE